MELTDILKADPVGDLIFQLGWAGNKHKDPPEQVQSLSQKLLDLSLKRELAYLNAKYPETYAVNEYDMDAEVQMESLFNSVENSSRFFDAMEKRAKGIISFPGVEVEDISSSVNFTHDGDIQLQIKTKGTWNNYSLLEGEFILRDSESETLPPVEKLSDDKESFTGPGGEVLTIYRFKGAHPVVTLNN